MEKAASQIRSYASHSSVKGIRSSGVASLPLVIKLATINGTIGVVIMGAVPGDMAGYSVSIAGDINGDGIKDVLVGVARASARADKTYVVYEFQGPYVHRPSISDEDARIIIIACIVSTAGLAGLIVLGIFLYKKKCNRGISEEMQRLV
jgi:hypothetical protein